MMATRDAPERFADFFHDRNVGPLTAISSLAGTRRFLPQPTDHRSLTMSAAQNDTQYPNPEVLGGLICYLEIDGAAKAADFYVKAFVRRQGSVPLPAR
jgi:hypothetical protein